MSDLNKAMKIAASGMMAQNVRTRVISQNIANADSLATVPGGDPYRRQTVSFRNILDRELGARLVDIDKVGVDKTDFEQRFEPGHPAADAKGFIKLPNVNAMIEMVDLTAAQRSYQANLRVVDVARSMVTKTIDLLR